MNKPPLFLALILTLLVPAACTPSGVQACPVPTSETKLRLNAEDGYCHLYPADDALFPDGAFIVINPGGGGSAVDVPGDGWATIAVQSAEGHSAAQIADGQINLDIGLGVVIERTETEIDGEPAVIVDGLPGPDPWRKVFVVHGDRLYTLTFLPWWENPEDPAAFARLENLYDTILRTLHFIPPTKALPTPTLPWGPGHLPDPIVFEYPLDGQILDYEGDYLFKVTDIEGAGGYLWRFSQNGAVVWENQRDEMGLTAGRMYAILKGSEAHSRFMPGPVEVTVRALMSDNQYYSDPAVITVILQVP
jgi:hypothetical protein